MKNSETIFTLIYEILSLILIVFFAINMFNNNLIKMCTDGFLITWFEIYLYTKETNN
jgi:hypothetical protein